MRCNAEAESERLFKAGVDFGAAELSASEVLVTLVSNRNAFGATEGSFVELRTFPVFGSMNFRAFGSGAGSLWL